MSSENDLLFEAVLDACRSLPRAQGDYLVTDYVSNLLLTVIDFQMHTTTVVKAHEHFKVHCWDQVRTLGDLEALLARYPNDKEGNTALAQRLWGYKLWTRAQMLRGLIAYIDSIGVRDQGALREWAIKSSFKTDFEGKVKGLGYAVFNWLVMRQGIDTIKPDVHVRRFVERATGNAVLNDVQLVALVEEAAQRLRMKAYELDWAIWEASRGGPSGGSV